MTDHGSYFEPRGMRLPEEQSDWVEEIMAANKLPAIMPLAPFKERHSIAARLTVMDARWSDGIGFHAHEDRALLLAEVERLRALCERVD